MVAKGQIFHADVPAVTCLTNCFVYVGVVHLAGAGIVAARIVSDVVNRNMWSRFGKATDDVPDLDLLVIDVEQQLEVRVVHLFDEFETLDAGPEVVTLMVDLIVQRLDNQVHAPVCGELGRAFGALEEAGVMLVPGAAGHLVPAHEDDLGNLKFFGPSDGLANVGQKGFALLRLDHGNRAPAPIGAGEDGVHAQMEGAGQVLHA